VADRRALRLAAAGLGVAAVVACGALAWRQQRVWNNSIAFWSYVAEAFPESPVAYNGLGSVYALRKTPEDDAKAQDYFRRAAEVRSSIAAGRGIRPDIQALTNLATSLFRQGRYDEARKYYLQVLSIDPRCSHAYNGLGIVLAAQDRLDEAIANFRRAIALNPAESDSHMNLGTAFLLKGEPAAAEIEFRTVVAGRPDDAGAHERLAAALQAQNKSAEAQQELDTARRLRERAAPKGP
jgi:tetratricopeptide (TPR) repeat protein